MITFDTQVTKKTRDATSLSLLVLVLLIYYSLQRVEILALYEGIYYNFYILL